jgi:hypothetical protein
MWALINKNTNIVVDSIAEFSYEEAIEKAGSDHYLVKMTLDNSPAYVLGYYDGEFFFPPEHQRKEYKEQWQNLLSLKEQKSKI